MKESYYVFGEVTNMSVTNQTFSDETPPSLPYEQNISAEFPFESNYVEVLGSQMHYIDEGEGDTTFLFMAIQLLHTYGGISSHM